MLDHWPRLIWLAVERKEAGLTEASGFGFRVTVTGTALIAAAAGEPHTNMNLTDDQQEARLYLQRIGVRFDDD